MRVDPSVRRPAEVRLYVALRRAGPLASWDIRGPSPGLRPLGTVAPSLAAARLAAGERWPDVHRDDLRVQRAGALPTGVLIEALAADGRALVRVRRERPT